MFFISSLEDDSDEVENSSLTEEIVLDETNGGNYLSLEEMGVFLCHLAQRGIYPLLNKFLTERLKTPLVSTVLLIRDIFLFLSVGHYLMP